VSDDLEEIEGAARTGGNLGIQISKALNLGGGKRGDLGRRGDLQNKGGTLFPGVKDVALDSSSLKSALRKSRI
jgi:hypothetical protein